MSSTDPRSERLSDLSECAYRLGLAFGAEAERAEDVARKIEYFELFERCFFAVRVATALELRLRRAQRAEPLTDREALADPAEREEIDPEEPDRDPRERDREGDRERASLPVLLKTLEGVAADAAALPGPEPAALPTLRELLAHATSPPPTRPPSTSARPPGALRARLAGSATVPILAPIAPARAASGLSPPLRRATGPPRR
jgi:hypothetical protein